MIRIKNNLYSALDLQTLRKFAFGLESKKMEFYCKSAQFKCGNCLFCRCDLAKRKEDFQLLTRFPEFICHVDDSGGYVDVNKYRNILDKSANIFLWGDLERLKSEVKIINRFVDKLPSELHKIWKNFYFDVMTSVELLEFITF